TLEAVLLHAAAKFTNALQRPVEVHRRDTDEPVRICPAVVSDFIVTDHRTRRTPPCAQHAACNTCLVHFGQGCLYRLIRLRPRTGLPAPQGAEYRILEPIPIWVLHPRIDNHGHGLSQSQLTIGPSCIRSNCLKMAVADTLFALTNVRFRGKPDMAIA